MIVLLWRIILSASRYKLLRGLARDILRCRAISDSVIVDEKRSQMEPCLLIFPPTIRLRILFPNSVSGLSAELASMVPPKMTQVRFRCNCTSPSILCVFAFNFLCIYLERTFHEELEVSRQLSDMGSVSVDFG